MIRQNVIIWPEPKLEEEPRPEPKPEKKPARKRTAKKSTEAGDKE